jgi:hypothetical protein
MVGAMGDVPLPDALQFGELHHDLLATRAVSFGSVLLQVRSKLPLL